MADRLLFTRLLAGAGAAGIAVALTGCGSASSGSDAWSPPSGGSSGSEHTADPDPEHESANWEMTCEDPSADLTGAGRAPIAADLTLVAWEREGPGGKVAFTTVGPAKGDVTYTTLIRQSGATARVEARLKRGTWRVTSSGGTLKVKPEVDGTTVVLDLPRRLPAGGGTADLTKTVQVAAETRAESGGEVYRDEECHTPEDGVSPTPTRTRTKKSGPVFVSWPTPKPSPTRTSRTSGAKPSSGAKTGSGTRSGSRSGSRSGGRR
ncbi:hypothetical protein [Spirillospora albida]|uniref:hypothetical protein n=1 Tax=Spirillospora albida TaxID=58123 RepID=UPI0004BE493E|nr:hypothetical protein [Spirillospora albida]